MNRIGDRGEMEAFVRSVELASFSAAARDLKLTPSALSKLVTRLESALHVRLLNRTTRKLTTTSEGALFYARCRRILAEFEDAENELGRARNIPRGRVRVHTGLGFATHRFVPAMPRFVSAYPEVQVELVVEDKDLDVVSNGIDISVRPGPPRDLSLIARKLGEFERIVCASPAYLQRNGTPQSPHDLNRHRCIAIESLPGQSQWVFQNQDVKLVMEIAPHLSANSADSVLQFALMGLGVVRLNDFILGEEIRKGRLVPLLQDWYYPERVPMHALYVRDRHRLPRVAVMLDFLCDIFRRTPVPKAARRARSR